MTNGNENKDKPEFLRWWLLSLFFVGLAWFWIGIGGHTLWDRDEPRYSEATRYMVESGDWVVPHFNGEIRYDKPILVYWLMGVSMKLFGFGEFAVRAPAGVAGTLNVLLIFLLAQRFGAGFQARMLAAVCGLLYALLVVVSKAATTDAVLTLTVLGCMALYWEQRAGFRWWRVLAMGAVLGLSLIHKGPVGPALVLMAFAMDAIWTRLAAGPRDRGGRPPVALQMLAAAVVVAAVTAPWTAMVWERTNGGFITYALDRHVVQRATKALESHGGPIYYYLPMLLAATFPFTGLTLMALPWAWRNRRDERLRFLWSWLVPGFAMFSLVSTKLPHYIAPLLPAVALMTALWWQERKPAEEAPALWQLGTVLMGAVGLGLLVALPMAVHRIGLPILAPAVTIGIVGGIGAVAGAVLWSRRDAPRAVTTWTLTWAAAVAFAYLWAMPALEPIQASKRMMAFLRERAPQGTKIGAVQYNEPTLVFYSRGPVEMLSSSSREIPRGFALLQDKNPTALVMPESRWEKWKAEAKEPVPTSASIIHQEKYFYANRGKIESFVIVANFQIVSK